MSVLTDSEKTAIIRYGLDHPFWATWLHPALVDRTNSMLKSLASAKSDEDDIRRGWIQALAWVAALPQQELDSMSRAEQQAQSEDAERQQDAYRSQFGMRSPFRLTPDPGETKESEPEPPTAQAIGD